MNLDQRLEFSTPVARLWSALHDIESVARCVPGARLTEVLDENRYRGSIAVKLGPVIANFTGVVSMVADAPSLSGVINGEGTDGRTSSRAKAQMRYSLKPLSESLTALEVSTSIQLSGLLSQFGKSAIVNEVSKRIAEQFVENLERNLRSEEPTRTAVATEHVTGIDLGGLIFQIIRRRITAFWKWLEGLDASIR